MIQTVQVNKVCNGLGIPDAMRQQPFASLSGGEQTRVNLGRLILEDTDILLLDEPTNHLDLHAVEWLEELSEQAFQGTVLTISHDRYFLDQVVTRVIEINRGQGGVLRRQLQLLRGGEGAALSGAAQAVREGAGQDRPAQRRRLTSHAPAGLYGRQMHKTGFRHGKAHRAPAQHRRVPWPRSGR